MPARCAPPSLSNALFLAAVLSGSFSQAASANEPTVRFLAPQDGEHLRGAVRVVVEVKEEAAVEQVSVYRGRELLDIDLEPPFEIPWNTAAEIDGPYALSVKARDADFREGSARIGVIVDNTPPSVTLTDPPKEFIAVASVRLAARASDVIGVQSVIFLANGEIIGQAAAPPYGLDWDTEPVPNIRYTLQARAVDEAGNSTNSSPVTIKVANFNQHPTLQPIGPKRVEEGAPLVFAILGTDPDGERDPLAYTVRNIPHWASFDPELLEFSGTPGEDEASIERPETVYKGVWFEVCDPERLCDSEEITVTVVDTNRTPVMKLLNPVSVDEGQKLTMKVIVSDPDDDPLACETRLLPKWARFEDSTLRIKGVPGYEIASLHEPAVTVDDALVECCDPGDKCVSQTLSITVRNINAPPVWKTIEEKEVVEARKSEIEVTATDPDGDRLVLGATLLPDGARFVDAGGGFGRVIWTPRSDQAGKYMTALLVSDQDLDDTLLFVITVQDRVRAISGLILNEDDEPVPGIRVTLTSKGRLTKEVLTDEEGYYLMDRVREGSYLLRPKYEPDRTFSVKARQYKDIVFSPDTLRVDVKDTDELGLDFLATY